MPKRYPYDLSHYSFMQGTVGKLQTLTCLPVVAGDSMSLDLTGVFRLSPLRRQLVIDCKVEIYCFYVPHRHIYGDTWIDFIKEGIREDETFPSWSEPTPIHYLGYHIGSGSNPLWTLAGYNRIWNRYFRSPNDANERADTYVPTGASERINGYRCGHLPVPWSTSVPDGVDPTFRDVSTPADTLDIVELNRVRAAYRTDVEREYFGERYNDLLNTQFGSTVNTDADERPTLCSRNSFWLSGYDVDGTDDATLGSYSGKSAGIGKGGFRRKFFPEHGALWVQALARFPTVHTKERPLLNASPNPDWLTISGDPQTVGAEPPEDLLDTAYFYDGTGANLGQVPFGQWYRYHPSIVHQNYQNLDGYAFLDLPIDSQERAHYIADTEYDEVFQTTQLGHWQMNGRIDVDVKRVVPPSRGSLFAGG